MKLGILSSTSWGSVFIKENMSGTESTKTEGVEIINGKLNGQPVTLVELEEGIIPDVQGDLFADLDAEYVVSLGEGFSCKKNLETGDIVVSSFVSSMDTGKPGQLNDVPVDRNMVDLTLKAAEKFNNEERLCKVVVGKVFLDPGTPKTGRKLSFLPKEDIYCMDRGGYPLTQWLADGKTPFVMVRIIVPIMEKYGRLEVTRFRWETARKYFWIVKGILEGLKKKRMREIVGKVD